MAHKSRPFAKALIIMALGLLAVPASGATLVVDQDGQATATNCAGVAPAFVSIGAAVTAALGGDTIVVCPGTAPYDEQVAITKALTVKGFAQTRAVIRPTALIANTTSAFSGAPIAALIVVADTTATLTNLVFDGSGANMGGTDCSVPNIIGVFYRNASGRLSDSTVEHIKLSPGLEGCQGGLGIFAQSGGGGTSDLIVDGVSVHDYQKNGVVGNEVGTTIVVTNSVVRGDPPANVSVQNGVQIGFGATGSVISNRITDQLYLPCTFPYVPGGGCDTGASLGVLVFDADTDVMVSENTISNTQGGIYIGGGIIQQGTNTSDIDSNSISATRVFDGIVIVGDDHNISRNIITDSDEAGVFLIGSANTVLSNRIQEAAVGIWEYSGTGNSYPIAGARTNRLFDVAEPVVTSSPISVQSTTHGRTAPTAAAAAARTATPQRF